MSDLGVVINWQKFILMAVALVGLFILVAVDAIEWAEAGPLVGGIVGYGTANGIGAKKGENPAGVFMPSRDNNTDYDT